MRINTFTFYVKKMVTVSFSRFTFQQTQVDVALLKHAVPHFVSEVSTIERLLDDFLEGVRDRVCGGGSDGEDDEIHMPESIVNGIVCKFLVKNNGSENSFFIET